MLAKKRNVLLTTSITSFLSFIALTHTYSNVTHLKYLNNDLRKAHQQLCKLPFLWRCAGEYERGVDVDVDVKIRLFVGIDEKNKKEEEY